MSEFIRIAIEKDGDGHTYIIPYHERDRFHKLLDEGEDDEWERFNEAFGHYAIGGSLSSKELYAAKDSLP